METNLHTETYSDEDDSRLKPTSKTPFLCKYFVNVITSWSQRRTFSDQRRSVVTMVAILSIRTQRYIS